MFQLVTANEQCLCMPALEKTVLCGSGFCSSTKVVYGKSSDLLSQFYDQQKSYFLQFCELSMLDYCDKMKLLSHVFDFRLLKICESRANKFTMMESNCLSCADYSHLK
jgi:hypothetical protein